MPTPGDGCGHGTRNISFDNALEERWEQKGSPPAARRWKKQNVPFFAAVGSGGGEELADLSALALGQELSKLEDGGVLLSSFLVNSLSAGRMKLPLVFTDRVKCHGSNSP